MSSIDTDVVVIGAGPVGLFQVFELGLQGLTSVLIDSLPELGGQCAELYPNKPIYDIPALPDANASEVIDNLWLQAAKFEPKLLLSNTVTDIKKLSQNAFKVTTNKGITVNCKAIVIAAGNGAFSPVKLKVSGIEKFENQQLLYHIQDPALYHEKEVVVLGGGDAALDWACTLQRSGAFVTLIHRSTNFRANTAAVNEVMSLCEQQKMQFLCGQVTNFNEQGNQLTSVIVQSKDGVKRTVGLDTLLVCFGMSPKLGPVANWDLALHHHQIIVDTERFQTSLTGVYAVGDINYYPGKRKLILSGFHESALAAFSIAEQVQNKPRIPTLYTTTSPVVHQRMGVNVDLTDLVEV